MRVDESKKTSEGVEVKREGRHYAAQMSHRFITLAATLFLS